MRWWARALHSPCKGETQRGHSPPCRMRFALFFGAGAPVEARPRHILGCSPRVQFPKLSQTLPNFLICEPYVFERVHPECTTRSVRRSWCDLGVHHRVSIFITNISITVSPSGRRREKAGAVLRVGRLERPSGMAKRGRLHNTFGPALIHVQMTTLARAPTGVRPHFNRRGVTTGAPPL